MWQRVLQRFSPSFLATLTMSNHLISRVGLGDSFGEQPPPTGAKPFNGNQPWAIQEPDSLLLCSRQCAPSNFHPLSPCPVAMAKTTNSLQHYSSSQVRQPRCGNHSERPTHEILCFQLPSILVSHTIEYNPWRSTTLAFPAQKQVWKANVLAS